MNGSIRQTHKRDMSSKIGATKYSNRRSDTTPCITIKLSQQQNNRGFKIKFW